MTQRERILALLVGLLFAFLFGFWAYAKIDRAFVSRNRQKSALLEEIQRKELAIRSGRYATDQLMEMEDRSLPSDEGLARSQNQSWLAKVIIDAGWIDPKVKHLSQSRLPSGSVQMNCSVSGDCTLEQLTSALYEFYKVPSLHRISKLPIKPLPESKLLRVNMTVETLVLATAPATRDFDTSRVNEFGRRPFAEYADPIIQRNMFSQANRPPQFARISEQRVAVGESLRLRLSATDPDRQDQLAFILEDDAPSRVRLDRNGELEWRPEEVGTYRFGVVVQDDGIPRLEDGTTVTVLVSEPPPRNDPPPQVATQLKFDEAKFTFPIASIEIEGEKQVWLQVRTKDEILRLKEGDSVKIGSIDGVITKIGAREMVLTIGDDEHLVRLGDPLVNAENK